LHRISKGKPYRGRAVTLKADRKLPRILTVAEMQAILDACGRLRDRFFFAVLHGAGCRAGEALGLRHEDIAAAQREISIVPRDNANGARAKSGGRMIPVGAELIRLYADYLHGEYGDIGSSYVFINLFAQPRGHAWSYPAVYDLVTRLRARTGIDFDPHWFGHSAATRWQGRRRPGRGALGTAGPLVGERDAVGLRPPDRCGRPRGAGEGGMVHRAGGDLVTGAVQITQAGRARWRRQAAAELARILGAHPELPAIAWMVGPAGCVLAGWVSGLAPPGRVREVSGACRVALALEADREQPCGGTVFLHAAARRSGVKVRVIATVFGAGEDR
jgi:hypothetical protein